MATQAIIRVELVLGEGMQPASALRFAASSSNPSAEVAALANLFGGLPARGASRVRVSIDSAVEASASLTLAVTQANIAVGEYLDVVVPSVGAWRVTAVTSSPDVSLGQFVSQTSNAVTATNMAAAVNGMVGLRDWVSASTNSGNLILTAVRGGSFGNEYRVLDGTVNGLSPAGGQFIGGLDATARATGNLVVTNNANLTATTDTCSVGQVTFTWVSGAPANENQVQIGGSATASAANLATAINAHSRLLGICTAANNSSATCTVTYDISARSAGLVTHPVSDATAMSATQPSSGLTLASAQASRNYGLGYGS